MLLTSSCDQRGILKLFLYEEVFSLFRGRPGCFLVTRMDCIATPTELNSCQSDSLEESRLRTRVSVAVQDQRLAHRERVKVGLKGQRTWLQILTLLSKDCVAFDTLLSVPPQVRLWRRMAPTGITWGANLNPGKCSAQPHPQPVSTWHLGSHLHFFSFADPVVPRFLWWAA